MTKYRKIWKNGNCGRKKPKRKIPKRKIRFLDTIACVLNMAETPHESKTVRRTHRTTHRNIRTRETLIFLNKTMGLLPLRCKNNLFRAGRGPFGASCPGASMARYDFLIKIQNLNNAEFYVLGFYVFAFDHISRFSGFFFFPSKIYFFRKLYFLEKRSKACRENATILPFFSTKK